MLLVIDLFQYKESQWASHAYHEIQRKIMILWRTAHIERKNSSYGLDYTSNNYVIISEIG